MLVIGSTVLWLNLLWCCVNMLNLDYRMFFVWCLFLWFSTFWSPFQIVLGLIFITFLLWDNVILFCGWISFVVVSVTSLLWHIRDFFHQQFWWDLEALAWILFELLLEFWFMLWLMIFFNPLVWNFLWFCIWSAQ